MSYLHSDANQAHGYRVFCHVDGQAVLIEEATRVRVSDNAFLADEIAVEVLNSDDSMRDFGRPERREIFRKGQEVSVNIWNGGGAEYEMCRGIIPRLPVRMSSTDAPVMHVIAHDKSVLLAREGGKARQFKEKKISYAVEQIAADPDYGLQVSFGFGGRASVDGNADPGAWAPRSTTQANETDWALLLRLAKIAGCQCWVEYQTYDNPFDNPPTRANRWTLHFHPWQPVMPPEFLLFGIVPRYSFNQGIESTLFDAKAEVVQRAAHATVGLTSFDHATGEVISPAPSTIEFGEGTRVLTDDKLEPHDERQDRRRRTEVSAAERGYARGRFEMLPFAPIWKSFIYDFQNVQGSFGYDYSGWYGIEQIRLDMSATVDDMIVTGYLVAPDDRRIITG